MNTRLTALVAFIAAAALATFVAVAGAGQKANAPDHLTIAYQPGIGYAPLILMKQQKLIEKRWPGTTVDWKVLAAGTSVTNGVISGDVEIGAMGTGPFLTGWARGVNWKIIAPLNQGDLWLMAKDPNIRTIGDLKGKRIAMPSSTSIQAVMLRKMAQVKLGDAKALDNGFVAMDHPDGLTALLNGQIDAHMTSPPFQFQEKARGAHVVARSYQYFGAHTFLVTVAQQKFYDQYTPFATWFYATINSINQQIAKAPDTVAHALQNDAGGAPTWRQFKQWLVAKDPGGKLQALEFTTRPLGLMRTAAFMNKTGQLTKAPGSWRDLVFPPVYPTKGS